MTEMIVAVLTIFGSGVASYGANRFALGKLYQSVQDHGRRLDVVEKDSRENASDIAFMRGKLER